MLCLVENWLCHYLAFQIHMTICGFGTCHMCRLGTCTGKFSDISIIGQNFEDVSEQIMFLCVTSFSQ